MVAAICCLLDRPPICLYALCRVPTFVAPIPQQLPRLGHLRSYLCGTAALLATTPRIFCVQPDAHALLAAFAADHHRAAYSTVTRVNTLTAHPPLFSEMSAVMALEEEMIEASTGAWISHYGLSVW